jgi:integrase
MASVEKTTRVCGKTNKPVAAYRARWRDDTGRQRCKTFAKKGDADRFVATMVAALARGSYIDPGAGRLKVAEYAERWRVIQDHRAGTAALYERALRLHVYARLGDRPLASVRHSDAQAFVTALSRSLAPNTARQVHAITRTVFRAAVHDRLISESPFASIKLPAVRRARIDLLTADQLRAVIDAAPPRLRALVILAAATGLRSGEMLGLTANRVDFLRREVRVDRQLVYVPGSPPTFGPPKTPDSARSVPLPAFAAEALAAHLAAYPAGEDGLIFQSDKGGPVLRTTLHGRWRATLRRAGVDSGVHLHHLRHWYASTLNANGVPFTTVQEVLGHAPQGVTWATYTHKTEGWDRAVRNVLETVWRQDVYRPCTDGQAQAADLRR